MTHIAAYDDTFKNKLQIGLFNFTKLFKTQAVWKMGPMMNDLIDSLKTETNVDTNITLYVMILP